MGFDGISMGFHMVLSLRHRRHGRGQHVRASVHFSLLKERDGFEMRPIQNSFKGFGPQNASKAVF